MTERDVECARVLKALAEDTFTASARMTHVSQDDWVMVLLRGDQIECTQEAWDNRKEYFR